MSFTAQPFSDRKNIPVKRKAWKDLFPYCAMSKWINITLIVVFALFLRCLFMVGVALGDDYAYAQYAHMIKQGMYPPLCDLCVFAFRPILLFSVALSLTVLGWSEFNLVLPILLSSLISLYLIYGLGKVLFDRETGLVAAFFLAIFPLNLVHASTMSNDLMLSMLVALSMLLFLRGFMDEGVKSIFYCGRMYTGQRNRCKN